MEGKEVSTGQVPLRTRLYSDTSLLQHADPTSSDSTNMTELQATALGKLLDVMPIPALLIDRSFRIVFANSSCKHMGIHGQELHGRSLSTLFSYEPAIAKVKRVIEKVFRTGKSCVIDTTLQIADQKIACRLYFQLTALGANKWIALLVEGSNPVKAQLLSCRRYRYELQKDVVKRSGGEKLLRDDQQWLELALKGAELGVWDFDLQSEAPAVNQTWADIFGYNPHEIEPSLHFWHSRIHPDDRGKLFDAWNKHLSGDTSCFEVEHRVQTKTSEWKWLLARGKVAERGGDGKPLRISGIVFDVTNRKQAEEKLLQMSKVFMDAIDPIFITDLEGNVVDLNRAAEQTYGWSRAELIGRSMNAIVPPGLLPRGEELFERSKRGDKVENVEATRMTKCGETLPVLLSLSLLSNEQGEAAGIATMTKNLSDLKRTEQMLRAQTQALVRSNKDLEEFAYVAAHDLREPLIGIAAYIKLLERHLKCTLDAQAREFISRALASVTRLDRLIQSLLWHSRLVSETKHLELTDCNVALEEALSGLRSALEECEAIVESGSLPTVMANPSLLVQVFQNLVSNAIRFAGDEPLRIRVGASRHESNWRFFVQDNGIGIEPPYFDRIFRIFQRIDESADRPGTGIGLANCKKIVEHHGGRIWVDSKPGKGSTFFFTMPDRASSVT